MLLLATQDLHLSTYQDQVPVPFFWRAIAVGKVYRRGKWGRIAGQDVCLRICGHEILPSIFFSVSLSLFQFLLLLPCRIHQKSLKTNALSLGPECIDHQLSPSVRNCQGQRFSHTAIPTQLQARHPALQITPGMGRYPKFGPLLRGMVQDFPVLTFAPRW